jgi:hypothetical protein
VKKRLPRTFALITPKKCAVLKTWQLIQELRAMIFQYLQHEAECGRMIERKVLNYNGKLYT